MTIHEIERRTKGHWWDKDTMRFFGTRAHGAVYEGPGGVFFVTSERPPYPYNVRRCSVREFVLEPEEGQAPYHVKGSVYTRGEFCAYSRRIAHRLASEAAQGKPWTLQTLGITA